MKIAILADIHGNLTALETVLHDIRISNVDQIIVLGDLITDFPDETNAVLDLIKLSTNYIINGNREYYVINFEEKTQGFNQFKTIMQTYNSISKENYHYISGLPEQLSLKYNDTFSYKCVHGSPFSLFEIIDENDHKLIEKSLNMANEKILFCGLNHKQWYKKHCGKYIVSPGSVGISLCNKKNAQYCIVEYKRNDILIEQKNISYNFDDFKLKYRNVKYTWTELCIRSIENGINYGLNFLEEAKKRTKDWPIPNEEWDKLFDEWYEKGII
jgi:predicted phosphodiesterase